MIMSHLQLFKRAGAKESDVFADSDCLPETPDNFNMRRFNRGKKFFQDNIFSCTCAMLFSLISGLSVHRLLDPLVFTQQSNTPQKSFRRYLRTFNHVLLWHFGDVWDPSSKAHKSIANVRTMHSSVHIKMMENSGSNADIQDVPVSQYDMSLVQCGFMGAIVMYSSHLGIRCTVSDLSDYCYFWYGIGYLLGIKDENNICRGDVHEILNICKEIEGDILLPALRDPPRDFHPMAKALTDGINLILPCSVFSVEAAVGVLLSAMGVSLPSLSFVDYLRLVFLKTMFLFVMYVPFCRSLLNKLHIQGLKNLMQKFLRNEEMTFSHSETRNQVHC
ncbi:uncharacterized protein LOC143296023 [Babylonia areolata]|uniref:uncharacterized protein LOC143296023 n=1 Tax=Babylonia areolata TaxID=304850 RepID=UPI003FD4906C